METIRIALRSLRANKMRSMLTMLGIIIGVASVVTMVAIGSGAQTQVAEQIRSLGANVLMVQPGASQQGAARRESGSGQTLTEADAAALAVDSQQVVPGLGKSADRRFITDGGVWSMMIIAMQPVGEFGGSQF